ncbi:hypothetical protein ASE86_05790 [Sphingomonas sp. Leaf33]|uniref:hypothetical protein n=1 Tax=Sphingomonas sp. Leaf33 TaxID=1736215 RepID=UPI0006F30F5C|nr:hypothetical protein [Sphingomonas sp. Leaf33]KQN25717.1 hypothetical protein ASE86_05790 [Sphingomonas sp. Leaf33]
MPKRTLIELFFIGTGLAATVAIVSVAAWAYPLARREIEVSGWVIAVIILLIGIGPIRRAWRQDRTHG